MRFIHCLVLVALISLGTAKAEACRYEPISLKEAAAKAGKVFVGTVDTVETGLVIFKVEHGLKNAAADDELTTDMRENKSSCAIRFQPGQRWLYLGPNQQDGSLLLMDEYGRDAVDNIAAVQKTYGAEALQGGERVEGTAAGSCAPWDGAAFAVQLEDLSATVYSSLESIARKEAGSIASYPADEKGEAGHGNIVQCQKSGAAEASNLPCQSHRGVISIGNMNADSLTGNIDIDEGEHHSLIVFKAKINKEHAICR